MATLTIQVPDTLENQFRERKISDKEIEAIVQATLEIWLKQKDSHAGSRFKGNAVPFVRQLISQNRELYETLAKV
ncbi:MAG: hypothetical protein ACE5I1_06940 [bacterium]